MPLPLPMAGEVIVIQPSLLTADHEPPVDVIFTEPVPPEIPKLCDEGLIECEISVLADVYVAPQDNGSVATSEKSIGIDCPKRSGDVWSWK